MVDDLDKNFEEKLGHKQVNVMDEYRMRGLIITKSDQEALHMFFSPHRIVRGLTDSEVKICIDMYPQRKAQVRLYPYMIRPQLYSELIRDPDKRISRSGALGRAIVEIFTDLETKKPINYS